MNSKMNVNLGREFVGTWHYFCPYVEVINVHENKSVCKFFELGDFERLGDA